MTKILLIGAGNIAGEYVKALKSIGQRDISVLSRQDASAQTLAKAHGLKAAYGGGEAKLPQLISHYDAFIVAAPIDRLEGYADLLANAGAQKVLIEKPAFLYSDKLTAFLKKYPSWQGSVVLNRLFYPSVAKLRDVIEQEPVTSAEFSFTEWVHRIDPAKFSPEVLARWGLSNCIHIIATVFDLIGQPREMSVQQSGKGAVAWHPSASVFSGSGLSEGGVPFTYMSDWRSSGRWSVTLRTERGSYILCPMEGLDFIAKGSVEKQPLLAPYAGEVKCGFAEMLEAWLSGSRVVTLAELLPHLQTVERIFGYGAHA